MLQKKSRSLLALSIGEQATIQSFSNPQIACKLIAMGVAPNAKICILRRSAMGNTYYLQTPNGQLAIRKKEAAHILIF